jgi:hypothetical protein
LTLLHHLIYVGLDLDRVLFGCHKFLEASTREGVSAHGFSALKELAESLDVAMKHLLEQLTLNFLVVVDVVCLHVAEDQDAFWHVIECLEQL